MAAKIEKTCALIRNVIDRETAKFVPLDRALIYQSTVEHLRVLINEIDDEPKQEGDAV